MRPLYEAAAKDDLPLLGRCLMGDFGPPDNYLNEALFRASTNGNATCASLLLAHGADVDEEDFDGDTPLMLAAINGFEDLVELYLNNNCDINKTSHKGRTALHMAVWNHNPTIVNTLILSGSELDVHDCFGETALILSAKRGYADIMTTLIMSGCDADAVTTEGDSALHYAAKHGHVTCIEVLLSRKRSTEVVNMWGATPLLTAAMFDQEDCCLTLLRHGAKPNVSSKSAGKTPLHYAASKGLNNLAKMLLRKKVNPDAKDSDGNTPLMCAVEKNKTDVALTLLQFGCNVDHLGRATFDRNYMWCSPLEAACHLDHLKIARMVCACGGRLDFLHCKGDCALIRSNHVMNDWVTRERSGPRSLADSCRIAIRNSVTGCVGVQAKKLSLPKPLQYFVAFYDLALLANEE